MSLTRGLLYIEELVNRPRFVLYCAACTMWPSGLCYAAHIPWTQDKLRPLVVTKEPAGSFLLVLATTPPVWLSIYLNVKQEVLM